MVDDLVQVVLSYFAAVWSISGQHVFFILGGGGVDPIPCMSMHRISDPRSGPAQLLPPHVKQRSHPHGVRPQIPDR